MLAGISTANRKWVNYEIAESWNQGKGVVGVYIYRLKNLKGEQSYRGTNPLDFVHFPSSGRALSTIARIYEPLYLDSKDVYANIAANLAGWIEEAIRIRVASG